MAAMGLASEPTNDLLINYFGISKSFLCNSMRFASRYFARMKFIILMFVISIRFPLLIILYF